MKTMTEKYFPRSSFTSGLSAMDMDRKIMMENPQLDRWVRDYVVDEIKKEAEEMLIDNMAKDGIVSLIEEFEAAHKKSIGRMIIVFDRKMGVRLKWPIYEGKKEGDVIALNLHPYEHGKISQIIRAAEEYKKTGVLPVGPV